MNENERLVTENVAENAENTAEQIPEKRYTEAEFNAKLDEVIGKKIARKEAKIRKEYDERYGGLMDVLEAGTGERDVTKVTDTFKKFYESKGLKVQKKAEYSEKDNETLARAEADEIIRSGFDEVIEETDYLAGRENLSAREQARFKILAEHRRAAELGNKLAEIGVTEEEYNSPEFKEFRGMFDKNTPIEKVYETYKKTQPKKEFKTAGSMKNTASADSGVKDYYSPEEARKFTEKDLRNNPALEAAILNSMPKWK